MLTKIKTKSLISSKNVSGFHITEIKRKTSRLIALATIIPEIKTNMFFYNCMTNEGKVRVDTFCT